MSILKLSNLFNLIAQQSQLNGELQGYHCGVESDINRNPENNTNVANEYGNTFPYLLFIYPEGSFNLQLSQTKTRYAVTLHFYDTQWRDNDGIPDGRNDTDVLRLSALERITRNFMANLYNLGSGFNNMKWTFGEANFQTATNMHNDRLLCIQVGFFVEMLYECETWEFDPTLVSSDYDLTEINAIDYETVIPT
jgi:hypothetical protein